MQPTGKPTGVDKAIVDQFKDVISQKNMHAVDEKIREIVAKDGLGVAILVAWRHGLKSGAYLSSEAKLASYLAIRQRRL